MFIEAGEVAGDMDMVYLCRRSSGNDEITGMGLLVF